MRRDIYDKIFVTFCIVTILGVFFSLTYALAPELPSDEIKGNIVQVDEEAYESLEFNSNNFELKPILDKNVNDDNFNVIKLRFLVGGSKANNIGNIVYDISLSDLNLDCELLSPYMKWKLIKNGITIQEGSLDYKFDTIKDGRLVLTPIQQDLKNYSEDKSVYDEYNFYMWLSDSCQEEDLNNCVDAESQDDLLDKIIKGKINIELNVGAKKELVRNPSDILNTGSCISKVEGVEDEIR